MSYQLIKCNICGKEYSTKGIGHHKWRSHGKGKNFKPNKHGSGSVIWNKGLTKETSVKVRQSAEKLKQRLIDKEIVPSFLGKHHTRKSKKLMRKKILERYASGWQSTAGRTKKIKYSSPIAGDILVDGQWELAVAKYLDECKVTWKRNTERFKYVNLNNKISTYCPDFFVNEWNTFIEVKGYITDLDKCKWRQFPAALAVWNKEKLKELGIL